MIAFLPYHYCLALACLYAASVSISVGLTNTVAGLGSLLVLISVMRKQLKDYDFLHLRYAGLYFLLYALGCLYSLNPEEGLKETLGLLRLLFALSLPLWLRAQDIGKVLWWGLAGLGLSAFITVLTLCGVLESANAQGQLYGAGLAFQQALQDLHGFEGIPLDIYGVGGSPFLNRVQWSILMALGFSGLCYLAKTNRSGNRFMVLGGIAVYGCLLVLLQGRSGLLLAVFGVIGVLWFQSSFKKRLWQSLAALGVCVLGVFFVPPVQERVHHFQLGYEAFQRGEFGYGIGDRLIYLVTGYHTWTKAPWMGHGSGSFVVANTVESKRLYPHVEPTHNPHNQYILQLVEHGIVGFLFLLALFFRNTWRFRALKQPEELLGFVVCGGCGLVSTACTYLLDQPVQHVFWMLFALSCMKKDDEP